MTHRSPLSPNRRQGGWIGRLVFAVGLAALLAAGLWPVLAPPETGRPSDSVLLDQIAPLRSDGTEFAFTVRRPSRVRVWIDLPEDLATTVHFGVPAASRRRAIAYEPLRERELTFRAEGRAAEPFVRDVMAVGTYILRVGRIPTAMGEGMLRVRARVTAEPLIGE